MITRTCSTPGCTQPVKMTGSKCEDCLASQMGGVAEKAISLAPCEPNLYDRRSSQRRKFKPKKES